MISRSRGFTLLELLLVIAIAGLIAGATVIGVGRLQDKAEFKNSIRTIQGSLREARILSISERVPVTWKLENSSLVLEKEGQPYGGRFKLPERILFRADKIIFYPKGDSSGGVIGIKDRNGREYRIEVDRSTGIASFKTK